MEAAGFPRNEGYMGEDQSLKRPKKEAESVAYPELLEPGAGSAASECVA